MNKIRIMIADDHSIVREGLSSAGLEEDFDVVGQASNGVETIEKVKS